MHGLRFLSELAKVPFDRLVGELGDLDQSDQVIAMIADLVENLPLPPTLPPPFVGFFRRIDRVAEIRSLAKTWQNCLADCLHSVNNGTAAVYRTEIGGSQAVAFVLRFDRLGWQLNQIKGPKNIDIETSHLSRHHNAFLRGRHPHFSRRSGDQRFGLAGQMAKRFRKLERKQWLLQHRWLTGNKMCVL